MSEKPNNLAFYVGATIAIGLAGAAWSWALLGSTNFLSNYFRNAPVKEEPAKAEDSMSFRYEFTEPDITSTGPDIGIIKKNPSFTGLIPMPAISGPDPIPLTLDDMVAKTAEKVNQKLNEGIMKAIDLEAPILLDYGLNNLYRSGLSPDDYTSFVLGKANLTISTGLKDTYYHKSMMELPNDIKADVQQFNNYKQGFEDLLSELYVNDMNLLTPEAIIAVASYHKIRNNIDVSEERETDLLGQIIVENIEEYFPLIDVNNFEQSHNKMNEAMELVKTHMLKEPVDSNDNKSKVIADCSDENILDYMTGKTNQLKSEADSEAKTFYGAQQELLDDFIAKGYDECIGAKLYLAGVIASANVMISSGINNSYIHTENTEFPDCTIADIKAFESYKKGFEFYLEEKFGEDDFSLNDFADTLDEYMVKFDPGIPKNRVVDVKSSIIMDIAEKYFPNVMEEECPGVIEDFHKPIQNNFI